MKKRHMILMGVAAAMLATAMPQEAEARGGPGGRGGRGGQGMGMEGGGVGAMKGALGERQMRGNREEMMKKFDADGDGKLSETERTAARDARKAEMVAKFDKNGDGVLSDDERPAPPAGGRGGKKRAEAVAKYDADGDGKLSEAERASMREARKAELLVKYDTDGDGALSDAERQAAKKRMMPRKRGKTTGTTDESTPLE